jgi:hypothetical protein
VSSQKVVFCAPDHVPLAHASITGACDVAERNLGRLVMSSSVNPMFSSAVCPL